MRPYVLEGLDCSGKKTIARLLEQRLVEHGMSVVRVVGPLVRGPIGWLDGYLANLNMDLGRRDSLFTMRRCVYVAGPIVDGLFFRQSDSTAVLKISSHYRAWARAVCENDRFMCAGYRYSRRLHVRFSGAVLLDAAFDARLKRHRAAVAAGETSKDECRRFLGYDCDAFRSWHTMLDTLMSAEISNVLRVDTSNTDPVDIASRVYDHALSCWQIERYAE